MANSKGASVSESQGPTIAQAQHYLDTTYQAASSRLRAGHTPEDSMMTAWNLLEAWIAANVDGCACVFTSEGCPDHKRRH